MTFFFDRCVPIALAKMVSVLETKFHVIEHHDDCSQFDTKTTDIEWLRVIGKKNPKPIVLSGDGRILRRRAEAAALREQGLTFFVLGEEFENMPARLQAWKFLKSWVEIIKVCESLQDASIYEVRTGSSQKVELYRLTRELPVK
jgi:hypothetical protein